MTPERNHTKKADNDNRGRLGQTPYKKSTESCYHRYVWRMDPHKDGFLKDVSQFWRRVGWNFRRVIHWLWAKWTRDRFLSKKKREFLGLSDSITVLRVEGVCFEHSNLQRCIISSQTVSQVHRSTVWQTNYVSHSHGNHGKWSMFIRAMLVYPRVVSWESKGGMPPRSKK